jgi:sterol desaturase/sphingolipid hydroxylase (fatty acid hydroxylase superfamily)
MRWAAIASAAYWIAFVGAFLAVALWESARPLRALGASASRRWRNHATLYAISILFAAIVLRVTPILLAISVAHRSWGLLNHAALPAWLRFGLAIPALDLVSWGSHSLFHAIGFLWRIHAVHHSDADYDVSTAGRFHPLEALVTQALYLAAIALLAPPPAAVLVLQVLTVIQNLFVHANKSLPPAAENTLRLLLITPDFHRVHHSTEFADQQSNFGEIFPFWDRLFRTLKAPAPVGALPPVTGLPNTQANDTMSITYLLTSPFRVTRASTSPNPAPRPQSARS